ncbi:MAG: PEP-utilizing enzyme [bacterium]|nr:PEP-utilizing enzyme [bacterium]
MSQFIFSPNDDLTLNSKISGGKGANLAQLFRAGFNVPPFFILSTSFYDYIIKISRIDQLIKKAAAEKSSENFRQIQSAILAAEIPQPILQQIINAWKNLIRNSPFQTVAVRSSALAEDLRGHSFAGQLETILNIQDEQLLLESIKQCWASLWNERVYHYISKIQHKILPQSIAVIVQQMIPAEFSGVCFTLDPTDVKQQWLMIEAHQEVGTKIVGGQINPARYRIHKQRLEIQPDTAQSNHSFFTGEQILALAQICLKIEQQFGAPQDIEWAFYQEAFYILQSRPITTLAQKTVSPKNNVWSNYFFCERFPQPVSPLGWSLLKPLIEQNAFREPLSFLGFHRMARSRITKCFYGRPYARLTAFQALHSFFPTAYISFDKRKLFYNKQISLRQSIARILKNSFPILKSLFSTTDWIPPVHLRNWQRFLHYFLEKIHALKNVDFHSSSDQQLWQLEILAEKLTDQLLKLHRWSITFAELIYHFFIKLIRKWIPQLDADQAVIELHRGLLGNKTVEMNIALWNLGQEYRFHPPDGGWNRYVTTTDNWESFVQKFGHRSTSLDISVSTFAEDENYILELIQQYQSSSPDLSPEKKQKNFEQQREERYKSILQILSQQQFGCLKKLFFKMLVNWSSQFILLRENQRHYWHQALAIHRKIFLEFGKRLFDSGWLDKPEYIFFLTRNTIEQTICQQKLVSKFEIETRIKQHQQWQGIQPPAIIDESIPIRSDANIIQKKLVGIGASPGVVTGPARVLIALQEMAQIQPGEILVVPTTDPGWTPLFGIIKGLVMEVGGVLSHGAIVAREFGIPAVTSAAQATSRILTGMKITVNGTNGEVCIHED